MKTCYVCKLELPLDAFPKITVRDKRCKPGHAWTGAASDCRECRKAQRRAWRRKKAEASGKLFEPRGDRAAWEEKQRVERAMRWGFTSHRVGYLLCAADAARTITAGTHAPQGRQDARASTYRPRLLGRSQGAEGQAFSCCCWCDR